VERAKIHRGSTETVVISTLVDVAALGKIDAENRVHPEQTSLHLNPTVAIAKC
jgi:hypothetical protein